ncbi:CopG family transcriptional regulator [Sandaracinobacteroides saxicola]|nr:CopG family transcriptional regulator [Sandaracinobacteroides saxicola]
MSDDVADQLAEYALRRKLDKAAIVEAAITSFLSPDSSDQREAALARRLDRIVRQLDRLERDQTMMMEAIGLFVRAWLTATPPLAEAAQASANSRGLERYHSFVESLSKRMSGAFKLSREVLEDGENR